MTAMGWDILRLQEGNEPSSLSSDRALTPNQEAESSSWSHLQRWTSRNTLSFTSPDVVPPHPTACGAAGWHGTEL